MYRLVEENELRRLIESQMIYDELCACGVEDWYARVECKFPDIDDIEKELDKYNRLTINNATAKKQERGKRAKISLYDDSATLVIPTPYTCKSCPTNPSNGGSGACWCTLGTTEITY